MAASCALGVVGAARRSTRFGPVLLLAVLLVAAAAVARWPSRASWPPIAPLHPRPRHWRACSAAGRCCVAADACIDLYGRRIRSNACKPGDSELSLPPEAMLSGAQRVVVVGDSTARRVYEALWARLLAAPLEHQPRVAGRHADHRVEMQRRNPDGTDLVLEFLWRPFAANVSLAHCQPTVDPLPHRSGLANC
eukprot:COSAG03_NODE_259_length_9809_cov_57.854686_8_plen_193_part_00